ncbi:hypothetical protein QOK77_11490 [Moraxella osloensis]|uniref:hypothetical protein n=1 Tax=Moraxella sp. CTOTU49803 TaxID=2953840 RepID=UPI0024C3ED95|nr:MULTISPECIES: hypothetical protein [Moraxella]MDK1671181.1 hypothetical protein [Moraxella osloensis]
MNIAIKCALIEAGIMKLEAEEPDIKELKTLMTSCEKLQQRTVKGSRILSNKGNHYLVESIYHSNLTKAQKEEIYTSEYEIGNPNPIKNLDIEDLYSYLEDEYGGSAEDLVKNIKRNVSELIGIPFETFLKADKSLAYKIITLFYRVCRQFSNQFFNFLNVDKQSKMQFEFRASFPYREAKGKGYENTALLAELLGHLTFSMPKEYLEQARLIETNLPAIADLISTRTRDYVECINNAVGHYEASGQMANLNKIVDSNLESAFHYIFESVDNQLTQRLDFLLYNLISLKEYIARKSSNELLAKLVCETPLELQSFQGGKCKTWEDKHVIPYLLGYDKSVSETVDKQTDFIEKYILARKMNGTTALPAQNKQILKAVIIHDSAIGNIKIESFVFGGRNIPSSITAILKKGSTDLDKSKTNDTVFSFENYPESILLYWVMRYQLALRVVMSKDKKKAIYLYQRIASWETRIDETLVSYVKNANLNTYDELLTLPKKFQVFLSNTIEPLS